MGKYLIRLKEIFYYVFNRLPNIFVGKYISHNLVKVHWGRGLHNFGDCLQPDILRFYGLKPVYVTSYAKSQVILQGSILQLVPPTFNGYILGTGGDKFPYSFPNAKVLGVRGELTKSNFDKNDNFVLGDPGLLMPKVFPKEEPEKYDLGIVLHFVDKNEIFAQRYREKFANKNVVFIDVQKSPKSVIKTIKQCKCIASTSLHGLIIADAFHKPSIRLVNRETMPTYFFDYKFDDYYSSLGIPSEYISVDGSEQMDYLISRSTIKPIDKIETLIDGLDTMMWQLRNEIINKHL